LIFTDVPRAVPRDMYDAAIALYADKVSSRTVALYTVGSVPFPGLSDIDVLLVPTAVMRDNGQFFSVINRLPLRYQRLFLHQPFVVPETALSVLRFTSHSKRTQITGTDVLSAIQPLLTKEERWCKLLESYCNFMTYIDQCQRRTFVSGRLAVAVASSMRYALRDYDAIFSTREAVGYSDDIDARRAALSTRSRDDQAAVREIWNALLTKVQWLHATLVRKFALERGESPVQFAAGFLQGRRPFDNLDMPAIAARRAEIDFYNEELRRFRFPFGHLFFHAAYHSVQMFRQPRYERAMYSLWYRARTYSGLS
jgi:hypothetical protein